MSDKKHIDRLFQEKLKDFEATPSDAVWQNIHKRLHEDKRKRRIVPIWWKIGGVAALLALLLTVGIKFLSNDLDVNSNNPTVDTEKQSSEITNDVSKENSDNSKKIDNQIQNSSKIANGNNSSSDTISNQNSTGINNGNSDKDKINSRNSKASVRNESQIVENSSGYSSQNSNQSNSSEKSDRLNNSTQEEKLRTSKDAVANSTKIDENTSKQKDLNQKKELSEVDKLIKDTKNNNDSSVTNASGKMEDILVKDKEEDIKKDKSIEDAMAEANNEEEKDEKEKKLNRWNISPNVAPVYFNSLGKGSSLDEQFVNNANQGEVTMSYGVGGSYAVNDRIKVRAGINKVDMGYNTNDIIAFRSVETSNSAKSQIKNVNMSSNGDTMTYLSAESFNTSRSPEILNSQTNGSISQRFGFIEVPMELEYAVINKKLGINLIGGFSTLIVDKNEIYSAFDGAETRIGEANNINNMSYSANFGLGINYNISEKIKVNVEPTFKYQINTFNSSSGDFQPYFIGVYTGLSYKF